MEDFMQIKYPNQVTLKTHYCADEATFVAKSNEWLIGSNTVDYARVG